MPTRNVSVTATIAIMGVVLFNRPAAATVIADWTFDNDIGAINSVATGMNSASVLPKVGAGTGKGYHSNSSTQWTAAAGGNPGTAFQSIYWSVNDYWEFDFNSAGYTSLTLSFDQYSSGSGPKSFQVETSTNGSTWNDLGSVYNLPVASWVSEGSFTLPGGTVGVRLVDTSTTSTQGTPVSAAGMNRVDNVLISGSLVTVPEPASLTILAVAALGLLSFRLKPSHSDPLDPPVTTEHHP
jgi:hypothetical protein